MNRILNSLLSGLVGLVLAGLCLAGAADASPGAGVRYVSSAGSDSGSCTNPAAPCRTIQYAINAASPGDEIRISGGMYAVAGVVADINKGLVLVGGYSPDFSANAPQQFPSDLDAQDKGTVVMARAISAEVRLQHLNIQHGLGDGNCSGTGCGGGIYAKDTRLVLLDCTLRQNTGASSSSGLGGAIYANNTEVEILFSRILSNTASSDANPPNMSYGGGIFIIDSPGLHIRESALEFNRGSSGYGASGGGFYAMNVQAVEVISSALRFNSASLGPGRNVGGGGTLIGVQSAFFRASQIVGNSLTDHANPTDGFGGGLDLNAVRAVFERNVFLDNRTASSSIYAQTGGALNIEYQSSVTLTNNLFAGNQARMVGGIAINNPLADGSRVSLVHNTVVENEDLGVWISGLITPTVLNNLLANNAEGLSLYGLQGAALVDHNLFSNTQEVDTGVNSILANPQLGPGYRLYNGSPALDSGLSLPWLHEDLQGNPRPLGAGYDLGALEGALPRPRVLQPLVFLRFAAP
jgi:hypothetical protein